MFPNEVFPNLQSITEQFKLPIILLHVSLQNVYGGCNSHWTACKFFDEFTIINLNPISAVALHLTWLSTFEFKHTWCIHFVSMATTSTVTFKAKPLVNVAHLGPWNWHELWVLHLLSSDSWMEFWRILNHQLSEIFMFRSHIVSFPIIFARPLKVLPVRRCIAWSRYWHVRHVLWCIGAFVISISCYGLFPLSLTYVTWIGLHLDAYFKWNYLNIIRNVNTKLEVIILKVDSISAILASLLLDFDTHTEIYIIFKYTLSVIKLFKSNYQMTVLWNTKIIQVKKASLASFALSAELYMDRDC